MDSYCGRLIGTHAHVYRMVLFSVTLSDPIVPQTTTFFTFCTTFYIFLTVGDRDFEFGRQFDHNNS